MNLRTALTPSERRALDRLANVAGCNPEDIAAHIVGAYLRLVIDAPAVLPDRPLLGIVRRTKNTAANGVTLSS